jgi:PAS domain S-box-containing protein
VEPEHLNTASRQENNQEAYSVTQDSFRGNLFVRILWQVGSWLTAPSPLIHEPEQRRQAQLLSLAHVLMIVFGVSFGVIAYWDELRSSTQDLIFTLVGLGLLVPVYVIGRTRRFLLSAALTVVITTLTAFALSLPGGGSYKANMLIYLAIPVLLSSILLPFRATAILIMLQTGGMLAYNLFFDIPSAEGWTAFVVLISVMILLGTRHMTQVERVRQTQLSKTQNRYRAFVEHIPVGVYRTTLDVDGAFLVANPAFVRFLGFQSEEDLKNVRVIDVFVNPADRQRLVERLLAEKTVSGVELHLKRQDGTPVWGSVTAQVVYDEDEGITYCDGTIQDITAHKRVETALRESEAQYRALFEGVDDTITVHDLQGNILDVNEAACHRLGYTRDELLHMTIADLDQAGEYADGFQERVRQQLAYGKLGGIIGVHMTKDGRPIDIETNTKVISYYGQQAVLAVVRDISERKRSEEALIRSEATLQSILRAAPVGVGLISNRVFVWANDYFQKMVGYTAEELVGQSSRLVYEADAEFERVGREKYEQFDRNSVGTVETRFKCKDGTLLDILLSSSPLDPTDLSVGVVFTALDITERKRIEETLYFIAQRSWAMTGEVFFAALVQHLAEALGVDYAYVGELVEDHSQTIRTTALYALGRMAEPIEYSLVHSPCESVVGRHLCYYTQGVQELFPQDDLLVEMGIESYMGMPLRDTEGQPLGVIVIMDRKPLADIPLIETLFQIVSVRVSHELTRRRAEQQLRESEARYRAVVENQAEFVVRWKPDGTRTFVNEAYCRYFEQPRDQLIGTIFFPLVVEEDRAAIRAKIARLSPENPVESDVHLVIKPDGSIARHEWVDHAIFDENGQIIELQSVGRDVTERIRMAEQVRQERDRAQQYLDTAGVILVALNKQGEITLINRKGREILGYTEEQLIGQHWFKTYLPAESADQVYRVFQQLMTGEIASLDRYENPVVTRSGEQRLIAWYNTLLYDQTGQIAGTLSSGEDITERRLAEDAVRKSEAMLAKAQAIASMGSYSSNLQTGETVWSDEIRQIQGTPTEIPSLELAISLIHPDDRARVLAMEQQLSRAGRLFDAEYRIVRPDGVVRHIHNQAEITRDSTGKPISMLGSVLDITERKQTEEALREQRALAEALRDTTAVINSTLDPERVFERILMNLGRVVPHDFADIMMLEAGITRVVSFRSWLDYDIDGEGIRSLRLPLDEIATLRQMAETGGPCMVSDTHVYPEWVDLPETRWVRSYIGAPIRVSGETIGFINANSTQPDFFTDEHVERLQAFADQAAVAINNARSYDDLERRVIERTVDLSVRNAVAETLSNTLEMIPMLDGVLRTTVERLGVMGGAIHLLSDDGSVLSLAARHGVSDETLQLVTGIVPGGADRDAIRSTPHVVNGVEPDIPHETGIFAVLSVPIWYQGQVQGVITLLHDQPRPWRTEETRMLDVIGRQIGVARVTARLYTDAVRDEAHIRTILQSVADGLLVFDQDNHLTLMNSAAEALFAFYSPESGGPAQAAARLWEWLQSHAALPDEPVEFSLPVSSLMQIDRAEVEGQCPLSIHGRVPPLDLAWPCWLHVAGPTGEELRRCPIYARITRCALQARSSVVHDADGQVLGTVIVLHDVTYFRELDELKGRFVSTVSHELRTPLSVVLLQVSTLLKYYDRLPDAQRQEMINEIQQQAHALRELIEDILELSRFDARRSLPQKQWFDLASHCDELLSSLEPSVREKHLRLETIQNLESSYIRADPQQVMRVLRNVVSNAIKYTPEGGQIVLRMEQANGEVRLSVSDTGIGIEPDEQLYVFDRFYRSEKASRMASGTGLGLSITKEIVDLHGGRIELSSTPGEGSTFTIYLPVYDEE